MKEAMKNKVGVWIDLSKAIIVTLNGEKKEMQVVEGVDNQERIPGEGKIYTRFGNQFSNMEKQKEGKLNHQVKLFLKSVEAHINHSDELVIFGPANMKQELADLILKNKTMVHELKGVETTDSMTDNQVAAWVAEYFEAHSK
jgi:stalled ribosome rescue protein Dom34